RVLRRPLGLLQPDMPIGKAGSGPVVEPLDEPFLEGTPFGLGCGRVLARDLDADLMDHSPAGPADLMPLLRDDGERVYLVEQPGTEPLDLPARRLAAREEAEVDADLDRDVVVSAGAEDQARLLGAGCHRTCHFPWPRVSILSARRQLEQAP